MKTGQLFCAIVILFFSSACNDTTLGIMNDKELKRFVDANLHAGDDRTKIEAFFHAQGWAFGFNQFDMRYESHYKAGDVDRWYMKSGVSIKIYVDKQGRMLRSEVIRSATGFL